MAKRKPNPAWNLASWFWDEILDGGVPIIGERVWLSKAPYHHRNRLLGQAKKVLDELDVDVVKECLRRVKDDGKMPQDILMITKWRLGDGFLYDAVLKEKNTVPPVYDGYALREWAQTWGRLDIIEEYSL
jgi:hypothetical protein